MVTTMITRDHEQYKLLILHQVSGMMYRGDGTEGGFNTKVVTTKRRCIPVAQINDLSGMTDQHSHALRYSLWKATRYQ